jgi:ribosomal-protein-alanine N-acetyltransferase
VDSRRLPTEFPTLETERLSLVELTWEHESGVLRNFSDREMMQYIMSPITQETEAAAFIREFRKEFEEGSGLTWALIDNTTGEFVGTLSFSVDEDGIGDLGFDIWRDRWGEGLMTEALEAAMAWGFDRLGVRAIEAHTLTANLRAIRLLEALGFERDTAKTGSAVVEGATFDETFFSRSPPSPRDTPS